MDGIEPSDLEQARFSRTLLGYDPSGVNGLVLRAAERIRALQAELEELGAENERLAFELETYTAQDTTMREALQLAQKLAEETKEAARREAELILQETRGKADALHAELHGKISDLRWELESLRLEKEKFLERLAAMLEELGERIAGARRSDALDASDDADGPPIKIV